MGKSKERAVTTRAVQLDRERRSRNSKGLLKAALLMVLVLFGEVLYADRPRVVAFITLGTGIFLLYCLWLASHGKASLGALGLIVVTLLACTAAPVLSHTLGGAPFYVAVSILYATATLGSRGVALTALGGVASLAVMSARLGGVSTEDDSLLINSAVLFVLSAAVGWLQVRAQEQAVARTAQAEIEEAEVGDRCNALTAELGEVHKMEALGRMAGGIAHDINNVLHVVGVQVELARRQPLNDRIERVMSSVETAVEQGAALTKSLLAFARKQQVDTERVELSEAVGELLPLLRTLAGRAIRIDTDFEPGIYIDCAGVQLQQLLMNLVSNARDAMPKGGHIQISVASADGFGVLQVLDDGPGIPANIRHHIFEPFFSSKKNEGGSGLGLATCHAIATQMGGEIRLNTDVERGACFELKVPLASPVSGTHERSSAAPRVSGQIAIVLDDDAMIRSQVVRAITDLYADVKEASTVVEALELFQQTGDGCGLVVADYNLGEGNSGAYLLRKVRETSRECALCLMSGQIGDPLFFRKELPSDVSFLPKPFSTARLLGAIAVAQERISGEHSLGSDKPTMRLLGSTALVSAED